MQALANAAGDLILVSNEVGMGIVSQGVISCWFVDEAGRLNQAVAANCERALWVAAGLPLVLKDSIEEYSVERPHMLSGLSITTLVLLVLAGVALDMLMGEMRHWHPLVGFGNLANLLERKLNSRKPVD